jgi:hypothetical protein
MRQKAVHPGLIHCEKPTAVSWRSVKQKCNLAHKWPSSSLNRRGQTLTKFKNIFYGVYWDQYQGLKTPVFWLNVFFQKAASPSYPHSQIVTGDIPLFAHYLDQET